MAGTLVGGAFLSATLQVLFDRLAHREVLDYLRGKKFNQGLLKKLKIMLVSVNALLNDAEEKQIINPAVKEWLEELEDAAYDTDDLLDEIATDALQYKLESESPTGTSGKVRKMANLFSHNSYVSDMENRMKEILEVVEYIANQKYLLDLKVKEGVASPREPTTSLVDVSQVYGRDGDKDAVLKMLREEYKDSSNPYVVIAIVGMGGVGKTTLAQLLYHDDRVKKHFELKSWVDNSERFDISMATQAVLTAVTDDHPASQSSSYDNKDLDWLQNRLKEVLTGKKFLLVLDNVWNENWEHMSKPFKHVARGSRILITTRHEEVAKRMGATSTLYHLGQLNNDACWQLFAKHAFDNPNACQISEENYKQMIVEKCRGSPLAAETLGGVLRYKENEKWKTILDGEIPDFSYEDSKIRSVLLLSYSYLPLHLKRCFVFCSVFPKGYEFQKHQLVLLWMAANLLQKPKKNMITMEEVGYKYFDELCLRSLFQKSSGREESCFVMHDLIHDLAQYVSRGHYFTLEDGNSEEVTMKKVRHLVVASHVSDKTLDSILQTTQLRTLLPSSSNSFDYLSNKAVNQVVSDLKFLRVLNLSWCEKCKELPKTIGDLKHLRYLDLSNTLIRRLPKSVTRLYNLQILKLSRCQKLFHLPNDMHRLINLRHLYIDGCCNMKEMPRQIGRLKSLQTLTTFIVGQDGAKIGELVELSELRGNLCLQNLENVADGDDASKARLVNKNKLEEVTFSWSGDTKEPQHDKGVLEELLSGTELKRLNIIGYRGVKFPNCFQNPNTISNIVSIKLEGCKYCQSLPALGELPSLKTLYIKQLDGIVSVRKEFYGTNGKFASLESLSFSLMSAWKEWNSTGVEVKDGVFPKLQELCISDCDRLITVDLPSDLLSLTKLLVIGRTKEAIIQSLLPRTQVLHHLEVGKCKKPKEVLQTVDCNGVKSMNEALERSETCVLPHSSVSSKNSFPAEFLSASLTHIEIKNCQNLESFPLHSLPNLMHLYLVECENLKHIKVAKNSFSLGSLFIKGCPNFTSFNEGRLKTPNLNSLTVEDCEKLTKLPEQMPYLLQSLKQLQIIKCPKVESSPEGGLPSNLNGLSVSNCSALIKDLIKNQIKWKLKELQALEYFDIRDESDANVELFPKDDLLPSKLTSLCIGPLASLKELDMKQLQRLTSLKSLGIQSCPKLATLKIDTALGAPTLPKLRSLFIKDCRDFTSFPEGGLNAPNLNSLTVERCENLKNLPEQMHNLLPRLEHLGIIECPKVESFPKQGV
ncbi:putative disease resistance protein At3g14460 isoform X3 [Ziziphus jujuba]|uniref:Disease resistance protein At3g14460 isoform X3 n=1 Tax=Ziziphus jujuba TaxID=326968 RepID=A0ABM3ZYM4_ZIZJJ|nr:putative disease resistance protein At3g14460 isoform X3 [Ziziphus jujuba]